MRWRYDADEASLYVTVSDQPIATQVEMEDGIVVDIAADTSAVGVEVLRAWATWDVQAVVDRFRLDEGTATMLRMIAGTFAQFRPPAGEKKQNEEFRLTPESEIGSQTVQSADFALTA